MGHKIRAALLEPEEKLGGIVEVDETYIGGKRGNRHTDKCNGKGTATKSVIVGAVKRKGNVVARVIAKADIPTLTRFVRQSVSTKVSLLCTDQWAGYKELFHWFPQHEAISHANDQYVVGAIHKNMIEGFRSIMKRGIIGTFHKVNAKYLPPYVAEFQFGYNNGENEDIFGTAVGRC